MKKILFLAAHADDELTSAATLIKLIEQGHTVIYVAMSWCDNPNLTKECQLATSALGIEDIRIYSFPVRRFNAHRQEILQTLVDLEKKEKPDMIFCPSSQDFHQDHNVLYQETIRAFKTQEVYGWIMHWNTIHTFANCPSQVTLEQIERKIKAMAMYETQKWKDYFQPDYLRSLARVAGVQFKCEYAESFEMIRSRI